MVNATARCTPSADDAARRATTSRARDAPAAASLTPRLANVGPADPDPGWHYKAIQKRGTGSGRMSYLKNVTRRFKNGFRSGTKAKAVTAAKN